MTLLLDHVQRLNLVAILDALEGVGRREGWAICALQDKLALTDQEREAIGWRKIKDQQGREYAVWSSTAPIDTREYELGEDDMRRICQALDKYPVMLGRDRNWWMPLTAQLPQPEESNGHQP